jgi:hypothetical protein
MREEVEGLVNAFNRILETDFKKMEFEEYLPLYSSLRDSNKVYSGELSVLFVDIRESLDKAEKI